MPEARYPCGAWGGERRELDASGACCRPSRWRRGPECRSELALERGGMRQLAVEACPHGTGKEVSAGSFAVVRPAARTLERAEGCARDRTFRSCRLPRRQSVARQRVDAFQLRIEAADRDGPGLVPVSFGQVAAAASLQLVL